jgi:hypothetical protein
VSCLGDADDIFRHLYAQLRELGWLDTANTVVVIVGDGAKRTIKTELEDADTRAERPRITLEGFNLEAAR